MKITDEIFDTLREEQIYDKYDHLYLPDIPNNEQVESINRILSGMNKLNSLKGDMALIFARPYRDTKIESKFNVLYSHRNPNNFVTVTATLKFININKHPKRNQEVNLLPGGYSGICLFEFKGGKPDLLNKLNMFGERRDENEHDTLYLSQRAILNRIFELINESQA